MHHNTLTGACSQYDTKISLIEHFALTGTPPGNINHFDFIGTLHGITYITDELP
jgi:hypothetical protein